SSATCLPRWPSTRPWSWPRPSEAKTRASSSTACSEPFTVTVISMNQKKKRRPNRTNQKNNGPKRIRATREYTAGGGVFRRGEGDGEVEILMIQDRLGRWTIPKGHVEEGESLEQTALREVAEETGLTQFRLGEKLDKLHFFYRKEGKLIFMTTYVFLMEAL